MIPMPIEPLRSRARCRFTISLTVRRSTPSIAATFALQGSCFVLLNQLELLIRVYDGSGNAHSSVDVTRVHYWRLGRKACGRVKNSSTSVS